MISLKDLYNKEILIKESLKNSPSIAIPTDDLFTEDRKYQYSNIKLKRIGVINDEFYITFTATSILTGNKKNITFCGKLPLNTGIRGKFEFHGLGYNKTWSGDVITIYYNKGIFLPFIYVPVTMYPKLFDVVTEKFRKSKITYNIDKIYDGQFIKKLIKFKTYIKYFGVDDFSSFPFRVGDCIRSVKPEDSEIFLNLFFVSLERYPIKKSIQYCLKYYDFFKQILDRYISYYTDCVVLIKYFLPLNLLNVLTYMFDKIIIDEYVEETIYIIEKRYKFDYLNPMLIKHIEEKNFNSIDLIFLKYAEKFLTQ